MRKHINIAEFVFKECLASLVNWLFLYLFLFKDRLPMEFESIVTKLGPWILILLYFKVCWLYLVYLYISKKHKGEENDASN